MAVNFATAGAMGLLLRALGELAGPEEKFRMQTAPSLTSGSCGSEFTPGGGTNRLALSFALQALRASTSKVALPL